MKKIFILLLVFCVGLVCAQHEQYRQIEKEIRTLVADIDSGQQGGALQPRQYAIALYQQILDRNPAPEELRTAIALLTGEKCDHSHLLRCTRSNFLAHLLAKKENVGSLNYPLLIKNLGLLRKLDLNSQPEWQPHTLEKTEVELPEQKLSLQAHLGEYNLYYGYLHAHTSYSDGEGLPEEAYAMVRDEAKLDFFSVTDHGILLHIWPWEQQWEKIKEVAAQFNEDHVFVALHGFEWSSPLLGHINVIHSQEFTDCLRSFYMEDIYQWISERPEVIGRFNHPGEYDYLRVEFDHFALRTYAIKQMVGIEVHNGGDGVAHYYNLKGYFGEYNYLDEANQIGWMVGAVGGEDNHDKDWGFKSGYVVGAWATELTREGILDAYRERRTFASEDGNLGLSFTIDDAQMGSRLTPGNKHLKISLWDGDGETFSKVSILKSGNVIHTFDINSSNPVLEMDVDAEDGDYYYIFVYQTDGDAALSSPIWIMND